MDKNEIHEIAQGTIESTQFNEEKIMRLPTKIIYNHAMICQSNEKLLLASLNCVARINFHYIVSS